MKNMQIYIMTWKTPLEVIEGEFLSNSRKYHN